MPPCVWLVAAVPIALALAFAGMPCAWPVWLGLLLAGLTAKYPTPARKSDPVDQRALARYTMWKDILAGLKPNKDWKDFKRVRWWAGWALGLCAGMIPTLAFWLGLRSDPAPTGFAALLLDPPFAWMALLGLTRHLDRREDRRHPYTGVSLPAFLRGDRRGFAMTAGVSAFLLMCCMSAAWIGLMPMPCAIGLPVLAFLAASTLECRKKQTAGWRRQVEWQKRLDRWIGADGSPMQKTWATAYVGQCDVIGDDEPLTVLRVRFDQGNSIVLKNGLTPVRPKAAEDGYGWCLLLGAKGKGGRTFDPNSVRLLLGKSQRCVPDATRRSVGESRASLVCDIAYGRAALMWHKTAPLCHAIDVSDAEGDDAPAAWAVTFIAPPENADDPHKISRDWLGNDPNPSTYLKLPCFVDLNENFHLYADPSTPLSDKGNRLREPDSVTASRSFADYVAVSRRFKREQDAWAGILPAKLAPPSPMYDGEREYEGDGWTETALPMQIPAGTTVSDYARLDLRQLDPQALFVGVMANGDGMVLVTCSGGRTPTGIDRIEGNSARDRMLAHSMLTYAVNASMKGSGRADVTTCVNLCRDGCTPVWKAHVEVGNGVSVADLRSRTSALKSDLGATSLYWEWLDAGSANIWCTSRPPIDPDDEDDWRRPAERKTLIELILSDAWGQAGISDKTGLTPRILSLDRLRANRNVYRARFELPAGTSMRQVDANQEKYLTAANYVYGRLLPRGDEHEGNKFDMLLARRSPFPATADADWGYVRERTEPCEYPLGVDDMGGIVAWRNDHTPHLAIMGKSGTGKSSAGMTIIAEAMLKGAQVIIIDPKKGAIDFTQWAVPRALAYAGPGQTREAEAIVKWVEEEMNRRVHLCKEHAVNQTSLLPDGTRPPEIFVFWDEFNSWLGDRSNTTPNRGQDIEIANANAAIIAVNNSISRTMTSLAAIAVQGRTAGIHLVLGGQRLPKDDFVRYNNGDAFYRTLGRILLGGDEPSGVVAQANVKEAHRLQNSMKNSRGELPRGRGLYESAEAKLSALQTWYSGDQESLAGLFDGTPAPEPIDYRRYMPQAAAQFGQVRQEELEQLQEQERTVSEDEISGAEEIEW